MMDVIGALVGNPRARHHVTVRDHGLSGPFGCSWSRSVEMEGS